VLLAAAFCPHPPLLVPALAGGAAAELDGLRDACDLAVCRLLAAGPRQVYVLGAGSAPAVHAAGEWLSLAGYGVDVVAGLGVASAAGATAGAAAAGGGLAGPAGGAAGAPVGPAGGVAAPAGGVAGPAGGVAAPAGGVTGPAGGVAGADAAVGVGGAAVGDVAGTAGAGAGAGAGGSAGGLPLPVALGGWLLARSGAAPPVCGLQVGPGGELPPVRPDAAAGLLVMGDGSARRSADSPAWLDPRGLAFDEAVAAALGSGEPAALRAVDPALGAALLAAGAPAWRAAGTLLSGARYRAELLHADAPYGVGYIVACWIRQDAGGGQ
jgi:hypothetical protein